MLAYVQVLRSCTSAFIGCMGTVWRHGAAGVWSSSSFKILWSLRFPGASLKGPDHVECLWVSISLKHCYFHFSWAATSSPLAAIWHSIGPNVLITWWKDDRHFWVRPSIFSLKPSLFISLTWNKDNLRNLCLWEAGRSLSRYVQKDSYDVPVQMLSWKKQQ